MPDIHNIPIKLKKHAAQILSQRFQLDSEDVEHYIKTAKIVKLLEKDGNIGKSKIQFICTIREDILYIITVEECK